MARIHARPALLLAATGALLLTAAGQGVADAGTSATASATPSALAASGDGTLAAQPAAQQHVSKTVPPADQAGSDRATRMSLVADRVRELADQASFSGLTVDEGTGTVTVYTTGLAPQALDDFAKAAPLGLSVRLQTTGRFTRAAAMTSSNALVSDKTWADALGLVMSSVNPDGTGLTLYVRGSAPSTTTQKQLESFLGLPGGVSFKEGAAPIVDQVATRNADTSPWYSGGRIRTTIQGGVYVCTAGFDVLKGSYGRLLSAHHCDPTDTSWVKSGGGTTIALAGTSTSDPTIDIELIDPTASPATGPYMYTGAWNSSTKVLVKNWATNNVGEAVCQSGGTSGTRCGVIRNDAVQVPGLSGSFYIRAEANTGWLSAGGDSGGPWYKTVTGGVQARGIHHGGDTYVSCGTINPDVQVTPQTCTKFSVYVPMSVVLSHTGTTLEVG